MEASVQRNEKLYRIVKRSKPDTLDAKGHPTSALFKDDVGVSVDRDGGRTEDRVLLDFRARFEKRFKALVRIYAAVCFDNEMVVCPAPSMNNIFHAEIYDALDIERQKPLSQLEALILADQSVVVAFDENIAWTR